MGQVDARHRLQAALRRLKIQSTPIQTALAPPQIRISNGHRLWEVGSRAVSTMIRPTTNAITNAGTVAAMRHPPRRREPGAAKPDRVAHRVPLAVGLAAAELDAHLVHRVRLVEREPAERMACAGVPPGRVALRLQDLLALEKWTYPDADRLASNAKQRARFTPEARRARSGSSPSLSDRGRRCGSRRGRCAEPRRSGECPWPSTPPAPRRCPRPRSRCG